MPSEKLIAEIEQARGAQRRWSELGVKDRLKVVRRIRHQLAGQGEEIAASVTFRQRNGTAETLASEVIPLADACRFLETEARRILSPRRLGRRNRPLWLTGVAVELLREPVGVVLIVGASNMPLFLPGVQLLQALAAGNAVLIKPGPGSTPPLQAMRDVLVQAGIDQALVQLLPEAPECVQTAVSVGVDKVVLTGSAPTGRRVQTMLANSLTPATMELSGCDSVFILESADLDRVARCLAFGLRFNHSATCIAPRRVFVPSAMTGELEAGLRRQLRGAERAAATPHAQAIELVAEAIQAGARVILGGVTAEGPPARLAGITILSDARADMKLLRTDLFVPVLSLVPVASTAEALQANDDCPYALGATVFGAGREARDVARRINAGCVVINDMIVPTADPRVPFGGRKQSGFGVTRGAAGLEEMTRLKAIIHQRRRWLPHLDEPTPFDAKLLAGFLQMTHGDSWRSRIHGAGRTIRAALAQRNWVREQGKSQGDEIPRS